MMKHPFDEIIDPELEQSQDSEHPPKPQKRRDFLKRSTQVAGFFAVASTLPRLSLAKPDPLDGIPSIPQDEEGWVTTQAVGEEGGCGPTSSLIIEEGCETTQALGEEGGDCNEQRPTTLAVGEEGGISPSFADFLKKQLNLAQQQIRVINKEIERMYKQNPDLWDDAVKQNWQQIKELQALVLTKKTEIAQINTIIPLCNKPWQQK